MSRPLNDRQHQPSVPLFLLLGMIATSGAGSLVLEVAWSRLLRLAFGSTTMAISTVLVAFMLGLGIGSLWGGRRAERGAGLRLYGKVELMIGLYALVVPFVLAFYPWLNRVVLTSLPFWPAALMRFALSVLVLIVPTFMMGATLPLIVAGLKRSGQWSERIGLLYGVNTLGAVAGTVLAAFVLMPRCGLRGTCWIGAGLDIAAALIALLCTRRSPSSDAETAAQSTPFRWNWLVASYGIVGLTALGYEVALTRALVMIFGSSVYAFAATLASFLTGIALGSLLSRRRVGRWRHPQRIYAIAVALLGITALASLFELGPMANLFLQSFEWLGMSGRTIVIGNFLLSAVALLPPTLLLGALFPLACRILSDRESPDAVAHAYFVNTIGSAVGSFACGFVLIPWCGLARSVHLLAALDLLVAALLLSAAGRRRVALSTALVGAAVSIAPPHWDAAALTRGAYYDLRSAEEFGIDLEPLVGEPADRMVYYRDGLNATVSVHHSLAHIDLRVNGKTDASTGDMSTQVLNGQLPFLFGGKAKHVAVIGLASGVTAGSALLHRPEQIDLIEIEPAIVEASRFFDHISGAPLEAPAARLEIDDGRVHLDREAHSLDVLISEPSNPFLSGCSNLFTREFYAAADAALKPDGKLLSWIHLYSMDPPTLSSILDAVVTRFEHVYAFNTGRADSDLMLLAQHQPLDLAALPHWVSLPEAVRFDLERVGVSSVADLFSLLRLDDADIRELAAQRGAINSDDSMFVELGTPWLMMRPPTENQELLGSRTDAVMRLLQRGQAPAALIAETAVAQLRRGLPRAAERTLSLLEDDRSASAGAARAWMAGAAGRESQEQLQQTLDGAIAAEPSEFLPRLLRTVLRLQLQQYEGAASDAVQALALRPDDLPSMSLAARALGFAGRIPESYAISQRLLHRPALSFQPRIWLDSARAAAAMGKFTEAAAELLQYLERNPTDVESWQLLQRIAEDGKDAPLAERAKRNAELATVNRRRLAHRSARWEMRFGDRERARKLLLELSAAEPGDREIANDLARLDRR